MNYLDTQQVCLNGHQITDGIKFSPEAMRDHCPECGEKTITECPKCSKAIPGHQHYEGVFVAGSEPVPSHCTSCGAQFPWTERRKKMATQSGKDSGVDFADLVRVACSRFHLVTKQLRERHASRSTLDVEDEYDVQDLLHSLLRLYFDDIRPEEWTPSYAGKSSRMDFLLKATGIVIEVKMTRKGLGAKELGTQLIEDIGRYQSHPDCEHLICFVYDPDGRVANPRGIERDLSRSEGGLKVTVWIVPQGY
ncbi:DUF2321 domain-containing protein [Haloferula sp. A504]|uniref:DUF2321 domain-containing protein n=1 Tax=Haloferula sp. A504 TaxID=3373601 RepID=UPI0037A2C3F6